MPRKKVVIRSAKKAVNKFVNNESSSIISRGMKESLLFLFLAIGIFLLLSLYSYSPSDSAWSHTVTAPEPLETQNLGGVFGSYFADISYYLLGYLAYLIPIMMALIGLIFYQTKAEDNFYSWHVSLRSLGFILTLISGCGLASMHFYQPLIAFPSEIGSGGILGQVIAEQLTIWFSFVGSTLLLLTLFLVGITFFSHLSWLWLMDTIGKGLINVLSFIMRSLFSTTQFIVRWGKDNLLISKNPVLAGSLDLLEGDCDDYALKNDALKHNAQKKTKSINFSTFNTLQQQREDKLEEDNDVENSAVEEDKQKQFFSNKLGRFAINVKETLSAHMKKFSSRAINDSERVDDSDGSLSADGFLNAEGSLSAEGFLHAEGSSKQKIEPVFNKIFNSAILEKKPSADTEQETSATIISANSIAENFQSLNQALNKENDKVIEKKPIKIQTADQPINTSSRANRESQNLLFKHDVIDSLPALSLLDLPKPAINLTSAEELEKSSRTIEEKMLDFNLSVEVVAVQQGPVITRFELQLAAGMKVSQLSNLAKDLARALLVISIRIVEVIAGKSTVGIEIPNKHRQIVSFYEVLNSATYANSKALLPLGLGTDISGQPVVADLAKMPHLLVAGTTGSGKSVGVNSMILSLLFHSSPDELRLIMVDPKMLELSIYEGIPHLLCPVVTDMMEAANALRWCVAEMERRYKLMSALGVRNIAGYNKKVKQASEAGEPIMDPLFEPNPMMASLRPDELDTLPYIVIVIDEFADMMMIVGKKVEELIARLAQKARAAGLHLIIATQRPSVNVITGLIKANIPTRIAFQVSSKIDSRTILDQMGAEALLGNGDMLFLPPGTGMPQRVHGAFVSDEEVHKVVDDLKERGSAEYIEEILTGEGVEAVAGIVGESSDNETDPLYDEAVAIVIETRRASISGIQRRLKVGYNRAARMVEDMEAAGLVSRVQSNGQREILTPPAG